MIALILCRARVHGCRRQRAVLVQDLHSLGHVYEVYRRIDKVPAIFCALRPQFFIHANGKVFDCVSLLFLTFSIALRPTDHRIEWLLFSFAAKVDGRLLLGYLGALNLLRWLFTIDQLSPLELRLRC